MTYAAWFTRVGTNTVDALPLAPFMVAEAVLGEQSPATIALGLAGFGVLGYNRWFLAGRTGQSWGRRLFGVHLVGERSGRPVGVGRAALRDLAHGLDAAVCYLGWLLPLATRKRQTIADLVCRTVVVKEALAPATATG